MPLLQENLFVICYEPREFTQLMRCEAYRGRQCNGLEPELGEGAITLHMDVRGLTPFITEKEEPIRADSIQGWHVARQIIAFSGFDYTPRWPQEDLWMNSGGSDEC
jgi:hypothetical protein